MMNNAWRLNDSPNKKPEEKPEVIQIDAKGFGKSTEMDRRSLSPDVKRPPRKDQQQSYNIHDQAYDNLKNTSSVQPTFKNNELIEKFRQKMLLRGIRGLIGLHRQFRIFDENNTKSIDWMDFNKACKDYRVDLTDTEVKRIFEMFDQDGTGVVP